MNGVTARWNAWGPHFAVAAAYAACYEVTRHVTFSHWILTAGLRLACLLLMPRRFWPALAVGEALPMIENAVLCMPQFGVAWAVSASVPMIVLCMPWISFLSQRWGLYGPTGRLRMGMVLAATLGCAVLTAVKTVATLATALLHDPQAWPDISVPTYFWAYVLGAYLGALTLTPTILALHERAVADASASTTSGWRSPLLRDVVFWVVPALSGLACLALATHSDAVRQLARLALMLPVLALALRHGWHGTAIAGMGASIALAVTGSTLLEPAMIQCQVVLALFLSAALVVGARLPVRAQRGRMEAVGP